MTAAQVKSALKEAGNPERVDAVTKFGQAFPGGYAEGDRYFAVTVPEQRALARRFRGLPEAHIVKLLRDPVHECRLTGLFILIDQYQRTDDRRKQKLVELYLDELDGVNHWDLVDSSAAKILGDSLVDSRDRKILYQLAQSGHLWRERVSLVACHALIRAEDFEDIKNLVDLLFDHPHDLIHKAAGWMLREMGNRDRQELTGFLASRYRQMPRTMLRYSIEKFEPSLRKAYLKGDV